MRTRVPVAAIFLALITSFVFVSAIQAFPGQVDENYGTTGFYIDDVPPVGVNNNYSFFTDGALMPDGSTIAVGARVDNDGMRDRRTMYVQKVLPSGVRDSSFGGGTGYFRLLVFASGSDSVARAVKVQPDGKIVVAGVCNIFVSPGTQNQRQSGYGMCAIRLLPSGDLDPSFGGNSFSVQHTPTDPTSFFNYTMPAGTTFLHYPGQVESGYAGAGITVNAAALDMVLHADGRITLAGYSVTRDFNGTSFQGYNWFATLATLTPTGVLDSAVKFGGDQNFTSARRSFRAFRGAAAKSDGGVVAVGYNPVVNETTGSTDAARWVAYDSSTTTTYYSENAVNGSRPYSVRLTRGNKILVAGQFTASGNDFVGAALMRFNNDLSLDTSFGTGGRKYYWHNGAANIVSLFNSFKISEVEPDGKMLMVGVNGTGESPLDLPPGTDRVIRLNPDGSVDRSLGDAYGNSPSDILSYGYQVMNRQVNGNVTQTLSAIGFAFQQADGKIIAGGTYTNAVGRGGIARRQSTLRDPRLPDFDGDGKTDISVFRPSVGAWYDTNSFNSTFSGAQWGISTDKIAPADFDGDGKVDLTVFRDGVWYIRQSSDGQIRYENFGITGDLPLPGDFNGDGFADLAVFRPSDGNWYGHYSNPIQAGNVSYFSVHFGESGDVPVIGDFDGDGKTDITVFRDGDWYQLLSGTGLSFKYTHFGLAGDVPVAGDYDGDSKADIAVFRAGSWYVLASSNGALSGQAWGSAGDKPVPGDYDKDGRADFAIYRNGTWWILRSSDNGYSTTPFGLSTDIPVPAAYQP